MTYNLVEIYQLFGIFSQNQSDYLSELKTFGIGDYKVYMICLLKHNWEQKLLMCCRVVVLNILLLNMYMKK